MRLICRRKTDFQGIAYTSSMRRNGTVRRSASLQSGWISISVGPLMGFGLHFS